MKKKVIGGLKIIVLAFIVAFITSQFMNVNVMEQAQFMNVNVMEQAQSILIYYLVFAVSGAKIFND